MKCEKAEQMISLWLDGMLSETDEAKLIAHLQTCRQCRQTWSEWERMKAVLHSYPLAEPPPDFNREILSRLKSPKVSAPPLSSHWLKSPAFRLASAAMGGLVVMVLSLAIFTLPSGDRSQQERVLWWINDPRRDIVRWLEFELGGETQWRSGLSPSYFSLFRSQRS
ncbi:MAG: anti-sigma factor family protein [Candidatus Fervidibacter sp.]|uniref:anti-sigma factor family protein n=1 Tax=Candidatus Fervidibacter sp. TaxID=3100871 RepID=UPI00404ACF5A